LRFASTSGRGRGLSHHAFTPWPPELLERRTGRVNPSLNRHEVSHPEAMDVSSGTYTPLDTPRESLELVAGGPAPGPVTLRLSRAARFLAKGLAVGLLL